jgi:hypothetical protein
VTFTKAGGEDQNSFHDALVDLSAGWCGWKLMDISSRQSKLLKT